MTKKSSIINRSWDELNKYSISFGKLDRGWDSYSAAPISVGTVVNVLYFVSIISKLKVHCPAAVPTASGDIQLAWQHKIGDLELIFTSKGDIEGFFDSSVINISEYTWKEMITNCPITINAVRKFLL